ncbi:NAD(P)-dependent oxidoreductase [Sphingobacterium rhinopitheci]|uniref:NAD(P)-dependent oxidoreductase n=1 Tax=Sphingobacterium rhinopitheci TaxID=2781960 RepID=UPI001F5298DE|nr:NAD(P)H-binding protein [Sphingobacterium rhinopitheci]MCI0922593.1 NAD(P)H-binding protein [Sphingobacterium rhinopitheci]
MKVAVIGSTGFVGSKIINELVNRNYDVLGISRDNKISENENLTYLNVDIFDTDKLAQNITGYDILVSAYSSGWGNPNMHEDFVKGSLSIQKSAIKSKVKRYIVIGGAGSLYVTESIQAVDTDEFPEIFKPVARAAREYFNLLKKETSLDWLYLSPALEMHPGITTGRTEKYRYGTMTPIFDERGQSFISVEDLAVAVVDEIEEEKFNKTLFTVAY